MTSGQETERVYFYNPDVRTRHQEEEEEETKNKISQRQLQQCSLRVSCSQPSYNYDSVSVSI